MTKELYMTKQSEKRLSTTIRKEPDGFVMVGNVLVNSADISLAAKGLYAYMKSKPDNWNFTIRSISGQIKDGQTAVSTALKELRAAGWVSYRKRSDGSGEYFVSNSPNPKLENHVVANPNHENPDQGFPKMGKSSRISNTDSLSNKEGSKTMADKSADALQAFEQFWNAGLRKLKRKDAETAFMRELKKSKMTAADFGKLLADDVAERLRLEQFGFAQLHPTTYLNGRRWNDEKVNDAQAKAKATADADRWWTSDQGIARKAAELGITPRPSESYRDLADRLRTHIENTAPAQSNDAQPALLIDDSDIPY